MRNEVALLRDRRKTSLYIIMKATLKLSLLIAANLLLIEGSVTAQSHFQRPAQRPHNQQKRPPGPPPNPARPKFGDPLPGLTKEQFAAFIDGKEDFEQVEDEAGGLGPIFNRDSCAACHSVPAIGGASDIFVTRFGRFQNNRFDPLASLGGSLLQERAIKLLALESVPQEANIVIKRQSTPLFGLGLMEAIPDATILRNVKKTPLNGVKGRASMVKDVASGKTIVGRFGWKAQQGSLLAFAGDAYLNEMGITSRLFPTENAPNGKADVLAQFDAVADPEDVVDPANGKSDIDRAADFMRLLAPPPRVPLTPNAAAGNSVFHMAGCANCHTPVMFTGPSKIAALNAKPVDIWSDLLLHDMGSLGDGIVQGDAGMREMKTAPLWGLRASAPYLHDGRAASVEEAIKAHDGEGKDARDRFMRLSPLQVNSI
jgi:CxxC motif-containing protein (DUF1111 family)